MDVITIEYLRNGNAIVGDDSTLAKLSAANLETKHCRNCRGAGDREKYVIWLKGENPKNIAEIQTDSVFHWKTNKPDAWTYIL